MGNICDLSVQMSRLPLSYSVGESAAATLTSLRISVPGCVCVCVLECE